MDRGKATQAVTEHFDSRHDELKRIAEETEGSTVAAFAELNLALNKFGKVASLAVVNFICDIEGIWAD